MRRHQLLTVLAMSIVYVVWGSTFYGVKVAVEGGLQPFLLIGLRFLLAGSVLCAVAGRGSGRVPRAADWAQTGLLAFMLLVCGTGLVAWSVQWISSSLAALLVATSPVWVTILDPTQKLTARKWLGLLLGLGGVGLLVGASLSFDSPGMIWGCLGCLASAFAWAFGSLRAKAADRTITPITRAGMQMIWGGFMLVALAVYLGEHRNLHLVSGPAWSALAYLTVFGSIVSYSAYSWLVANVPAGMVATHAYVNPVVAVVLGSWLGGEVLSPQAGLAAVIALSGVVILMLPEPKVEAPALALVASSQGEAEVEGGPRAPRPLKPRRRSWLRAS